MNHKLRWGIMHVRVLHDTEGNKGKKVVPAASGSFNNR